MEKSIIIPNGINAEYFENKGQPKKLDPSKPIRFIQVGQIRKRKNGLGSIQAIKLFMEKTGIEAQLLFVGKIVEKDYAEQINKKGQGLVTIHSPVEVNELISIYRENDIFIMPSFSETFGLVYPEAMSQGLPVLYTKGQGFDGQYEDGYVGYPACADDPKDIAEKIQWIVKDYKELSENALEAYDKFNWEILSENYKEIYLNIVDISK